MIAAGVREGRSLGIARYVDRLASALGELGVAYAAADAPVAGALPHFHLGNSSRRVARQAPLAGAPYLLTVHDVVPRTAALAPLYRLAVYPLAVRRAARVVTYAIFSALTVWRLFAAAAALAPHPKPTVRWTDELPTYTVLCPLYREANMMQALARRLLSIDYPAEKLDVKLILEADDEETRRVAERAIEGTRFEIVVAPPVPPRTKPRALVVALGSARGELVTVYDAEDRPHPMQLREAHAAFSRAGPELACVQAPLLIDNLKAGALARYFALEYAALFDGLLPALAALHMPLPLGGTSNHFRGLR